MEAGRKPAQGVVLSAAGQMGCLRVLDDVVRFTPSDREGWRAGDLPRLWASRYWQVFDEDDLRLGLSQPDYHFCEWVGAICFFLTQGCLSLVEKYGCPSHLRKEVVLNRLTGPEFTCFLEHAPQQPPDLLVYAPDYSDWFFCEVKGPGDRLGAEQEDFFGEIEARTGKEIYLLRVVETSEDSWFLRHACAGVSG